MAIYGIGARYGDKDVSKEFISRGLACVGYEYEDAPSLHKLLNHIKVGDLIYIKSYPPNIGLIIKAVGIVIDDEVKTYRGLERGLKVKYVWKGNEVIGQLKEDPYNVRNITLYEEFNPDVQKKVIQFLLNSNYPKIKRKLKP